MRKGRQKAHLMKNAQLADLLRPDSFDGIVGQDHLFGPRGILRRMLADKAYS